MLLNFPPRSASIITAPQSSVSPSAETASEARTEYRVRASARLTLDAGSKKASGALGMRVNDLSVVLRLHHDDKTFWGVVSGASDLGAVSFAMENSHLAPSVVLLHRGAALSSEASDIDSTAVLSADGRRQGSVGVQMDESALGRIPMAALAQLVRLSRYYFCRSFKRSFGFLPRGYRIGLRIEARPERTPGQASAKDMAVAIDFVATGAFTAAIAQPADPRAGAPVREFRRRPGASA
jgi:AraC-like DNA-binding protein